MSPMPKRKSDNEGNVKKKVKDIFTRHGWFWWMPPSNAYGKTGIADFHAFKNGVFVAVETKRGRSGLAETQPTANQIGFLNSIRAERGFAFVVYEDRLAHLDAFLAAFARAVAATAKQEKVADEDGAAMCNCIAELTKELGG